MIRQHTCDAIGSPTWPARSKRYVVSSEKRFQDRSKPLSIDLWMSLFSFAQEARIASRLRSRPSNSSMLWTWLRCAGDSGCLRPGGRVVRRYSAADNSPRRCGMTELSLSCRASVCEQTWSPRSTDFAAALAHARCRPCVEDGPPTPYNSSWHGRRDLASLSLWKRDSTLPPAIRSQGG
jgi:hypothetical protein